MVCKIIVSPPKTIKCNTPFGLIVRCDDYNLMQRFISIYTDKFTATAYLRSPNGEPLNIDGGDWRSNFSLNQNEAQGKDAHIPHIEEGNYIDPDSGREFINAEMEERNIMPEVLEKGLYFRFRDLQIQRPAQSAGLEDGEIREFKIEIEFKSYDEDGHHLHGIRNPGTAVTGVITVSEEDTVEEHVIRKF